MQAMPSGGAPLFSSAFPQPQALSASLQDAPSMNSSAEEVPLTPVQARIVSFLKEAMEKWCEPEKKFGAVSAFQLDKQVISGSLAPLQDLRKALHHLTQEGFIIAYAYGGEAASFLIRLKEGDCLDEKVNEAVKKGCSSEWYSKANPEQLQGALNMQSPEDLSERDVRRILYQEKKKKLRTLTFAQLNSLLPLFARFAGDRVRQEKEYGNQNPDVVVVDPKAFSDLNPEKVKLLLRFLVLSGRVVAMGYSSAQQKELFKMYFTPEAIEWNGDVLTRNQMLLKDAVLQEQKKKQFLIPIEFTKTQSRLCIKILKHIGRQRAERCVEMRREARQFIFYSSRLHYQPEDINAVLRSLVQQGFLHSWVETVRHDRYIKFDPMDVQSRYAEEIKEEWQDAAAINRAEELKRANKIAVPDNLEANLSFKHHHLLKAPVPLSLIETASLTPLQNRIAIFLRARILDSYNTDHLIHREGNIFFIKRKIVPVRIQDIDKHVIAGSMAPAEDIRKALQHLTQDGVIDAYAYGGKAGSFLVRVKKGDHIHVEEMRECASEWYSTTHPEPLQNMAALKILKSANLSENEMRRILYQGIEKIDQTLTISQLNSLLPLFESFARDRLQQEKEFGNPRPDVVVVNPKAFSGLDPEKVQILLRFLVLSGRAAALNYTDSLAHIYLTAEAIDWEKKITTRDQMLRMDAALQEHKKIEPVIPLEFTKEEGKFCIQIFKEIGLHKAERCSGGSREYYNLLGRSYDHVTIVVLNSLVQQGFIHSWIYRSTPFPDYYIKFDKSDAAPEYLDLKEGWHDYETVKRADEFNKANKIVVPDSLQFPAEVNREVFTRIINELNQRGKAGPYELKGKHLLKSDGLVIARKELDFAKKEGYIHDFLVTESSQPDGRETVVVYVKASDRN